MSPQSRLSVDPQVIQWAGMGVSTVCAFTIPFVARESGLSLALVIATAAGVVTAFVAALANRLQRRETLRQGYRDR